MTAGIRHLLFTWLALLVLGTIELGGSVLPIPRSARTLLLLPAILMVLIVVLVFMRIRTGPGVVRIFAVASVFWLTILLGLGMMDPLTRGIYPVQSSQVDER
jgi:cytochrome c oxidase subunit IV